MAATGKTPILLYGSTTPTNAPTAGNLTNSSDGCEIAINVADKNLFFKDSTNAVNTVPIRQSSASSNGWLSSTDWNTFNGKQAALGYTPVNKAGDTMSGSLTSPAFIPSNSTVPTNGMYYPAANTLGWATNGANRLNLDGSGNLMLGTNTFSAIFGTRTVAIYSAGGATSYITTGTHNVFTAVTTGGAASFGTSTATTVVSLGVAAGESLNLDASRNVKVTAGNLVIGTSGKGIDFSATAGTGTSELLADYEEGTWTPTDNSGASLTFTNTSGNCYYTKVGNVVTCVFNVTYPATASTASANIAGLPYVSKSTTSSVAGGCISYTDYATAITLINVSAATNFLFYTFGAANVTNANLSGKTIRGVIKYLV